MYVTPKKPCIIVMPCLISTQHLGAVSRIKLSRLRTNSNKQGRRASYPAAIRPSKQMRHP